MKNVGFWIAVAIIFVFVALLVGCAGDPVKPEVVTVVKQLPPVQVPIPVRCIDPADVPEIPPTAMRPDDGLWDNLPQLRADLNAFKIYALKADPLLKGCATESQPTTEVKK